MTISKEELDATGDNELLMVIEELTTSVENMKMYRKDTADNKNYIKRVDELYILKQEANKRGLKLHNHFGIEDPVRDSMLAKR